MARIAVIKESLEKALRDESKPWAGIFASAESKTGIDRLYIFLGAAREKSVESTESEEQLSSDNPPEINSTLITYASVGFLALYLVIGIGQQLVCNIIGFLYPAYCSMKALESPNKDDDTKWLTYWVVFAVFTIIEFFADYIVYWLPIYWLIKCLFYVWLMVPMEYNGSMILYRRIIRPKFLQYQPNVDALISNARNSAVKIAANALSNEKKD